jgi:hypothetical protein
MTIMKLLEILEIYIKFNRIKLIYSNNSNYGVREWKKTNQ